MKILCLFLLSGFLLIIFSPCSAAGNKQMVEESVKELDDLNKEAVRQIPDLPDKGRVDMKADVTYEKEMPVFNLRYKKITTEKEGRIIFDNNQDMQSTGNEASEENDDKDN